MLARADRMHARALLRESESSRRNRRKFHVRAHKNDRLGCVVAAGISDRLHYGSGHSTRNVLPSSVSNR